MSICAVIVVKWMTNQFRVYTPNLMPFIPFSAGIDFRRQILTSKVDPRTENINMYNDRGAHNKGIEIRRKELTKTFMVISNWKNTSLGLYTNMSSLYDEGYTFTCIKVSACIATSCIIQCLTHIIGFENKNETLKF